MEPVPKFLFLPAFNQPFFSVRSYFDMISCEVGYINICKSCITTKKKQIAYQSKSPFKVIFVSHSFGSREKIFT